MSVIRRLENLRARLENLSSTRRCAFEQLLIVERIIKMVRCETKSNFHCCNCMVFESLPKKPGWGTCRLNNNLTLVNEIQDWCLAGIKVTQDASNENKTDYEEIELV